jgi:glycogen(starch) synthase
MVSWEYPPLVYGGLGRHVHGLAEALVADGHEVAVVTQSHAGAPDDAVVGGVRVRRVRPDPPARSARDDLALWTLALNAAQVRAGQGLLRDWRADLVHAHDWLAAHAGVALARAAAAPLVATIHATEAGLWNGWLVTPVSRARHDVEAWLVRQAARTIVCSTTMRAEVSTALGVSEDDLAEVHNAVHVQPWRSSTTERVAIRERLAVPQDSPLLVLAGRIEWEKGGHVAVDALPRIRRRHAEAHLVLAGAGSQVAALREQARRRRVARATRFAGRLADADLAALLGTADVALVPSTYEPFGMIALEAAAAGTPVVAADAGGLREVVTDGVTGLLVPPHDAAALAGAVIRLLDDPSRAAALADAARRMVEARYGWPLAARATEKVYAEAVSDPRPPRPRLPPVRPGNVFTGEPVGP